jgi:hypothetical protein
VRVQLGELAFTEKPERRSGCVHTLNSIGALRKVEQPTHRYRKPDTTTTR